MDAGPLPGEIDPDRFCRAGESLEFSAAVADFPRLAAEFSHGTLACRIAGQVDNIGPRLRLTIDGTVETSCQRCLGPLSLTLALTRVIRLARDDIELERLDADSGSDAIPLATRLDPVALIEDEILLSLPMAAMHESGACTTRVAGV